MQTLGPQIKPIGSATRLGYLRDLLLCDSQKRGPSQSHPDLARTAGDQTRAHEATSRLSPQGKKVTHQVK